MFDQGRSPIRALGALLFLSLWTAALGQNRPNVVFIFADDLGYGDLKVYGHPYAETPNLDRLAAEGTVFKNFHVTGITCSPSRTGFMTSRSPVSYPNYMADFGFQGVPTITEILGNAGYRTGHFGKWHIGPDEEDGVYGIDHVEIIGGGMGKDGVRDSRLFEAAMEFMEDEVKANSTKPFYVNIWGHISHSPVRPPPSLVKQFKNINIDSKDFGRHMQKKIKGHKKNANKMMQEYVAEVNALDKLVGNVMDQLENLGVRENTIIVFSSDQGPTPAYMGSSGEFRGGKFEFYEGGVRVPFIASWPAAGGIPQGKVNENSLMSALDWIPTLCAITGADCDMDMYEGENMVDVWKGESDRSRSNPLFWGLSRSNSKYAMLYDKWKLHTSKKSKQLYDLKENPEEDEDIFSSNKRIGDAMMDILHTWKETLPEKYCHTDKGCNMTFIFDPEQIITVTGPSKELMELTGPMTAAPTTSMFPTEEPSLTPSMAPSISMYPTEAPSLRPSMAPSISKAPTKAPSLTPSMAPSISMAPTRQPSLSHSMAPSMSAAPTKAPIVAPSMPPSISMAPTKEFTAAPSKIPTKKNTAEPSMVPTKKRGKKGLR